MTADDLWTEYWAAHYYEQDPNARSEEFDNDDFDADLAAFTQHAQPEVRQPEADQAPPDPGDWEDIDIG